MAGVSGSRSFANWIVTRRGRSSQHRRDRSVAYPSTVRQRRVSNPRQDGTELAPSCYTARPRSAWRLARRLLEVEACCSEEPSRSWSSSGRWCSAALTHGSDMIAFCRRRRSSDVTTSSCAPRFGRGSIRPGASNCDRKERNGGRTSCFWHRRWSNRYTSTDIGGAGMKRTSTHSGPTISAALRSISRQRTLGIAEPPCTTATSARVTTRSPSISCRFRAPPHSSQRHHHRRRQSQIEIVTRWGRRSVQGGVATGASIGHFTRSVSPVDRAIAFRGSDLELPPTPPGLRGADESRAAHLGSDYRGRSARR